MFKVSKYYEMNMDKHTYRYTAVQSLTFSVILVLSRAEAAFHKAVVSTQMANTLTRIRISYLQLICHARYISYFKTNLQLSFYSLEAQNKHC